MMALSSDGPMWPNVPMFFMLCSEHGCSGRPRLSINTQHICTYRRGLCNISVHDICAIWRGRVGDFKWIALEHHYDNWWTDLAIAHLLPPLICTRTLINMHGSCGSFWFKHSTLLATCLPFWGDHSHIRGQLWKPLAKRWKSEKFACVWSINLAGNWCKYLRIPLLHISELCFVIEII